MMKRYCVIGCFLVGLLVICGCGASAKQLEQTDKCRQRCHLDSIECLESMDCTDVSGQLIPCEDQCERARVECEEQCY